MKHVTGFAIAASALALLAGCDKASNEAAVDTAKIEQQIKDIETQWQADYGARSVDTLAAHYSDDAALINPGAALAADAASRRAGIEQFISDPTMKIDFASDRVLVAKSGELATSRGHYSIETTDPKTKLSKTESGTYLTVYRKQADGGWRAVEDAVIPGAPTAAPATAP